MVQLFILTRVIKCMCAGVGETGAPREKPTIKPIFKINLAATNKLEYLINLSQGEAWQSWDVISDIKEFTQEGGPPRFSLWNWKVFHHFLHNVLTGRKVYLTLFSYLPQGSTKNSSLILLTKTGQVSNSKLVRLQQGLVKSSKPVTQHDLGVVTASLLLNSLSSPRTPWPNKFQTNHWKSKVGPVNLKKWFDWKSGKIDGVKRCRNTQGDRIKPIMLKVILSSCILSW